MDSACVFGYSTWGCMWSNWLRGPAHAGKHRRSRQRSQAYCHRRSKRRPRAAGKVNWVKTGRWKSSSPPHRAQHCRRRPGRVNPSKRGLDEDDAGFIGGDLRIERLRLRGQMVLEGFVCIAGVRLAHMRQGKTKESHTRKIAAKRFIPSLLPVFFIYSNIFSEAMQCGYKNCHRNVSFA